MDRAHLISLMKSLLYDNEVETDIGKLLRDKWNIM